MLEDWNWIDGWSWTLPVIVGPLLLALVIAAGMLITRRRRSDPEARRRTEEGTRRIYHDSSDRAD